MAGLILDASALIAYLREEPGAEIVGPMIADAAMSLVNFSEVATFFARTGEPRAMIEELLDQVQLELAPCDQALAIDVGMLEPLTRSAGLSLGDRHCLALGKRRGVPVWTADRFWLDVAERVGVEVRLIR